LKYQTLTRGLLAAAFVALLFPRPAAGITAQLTLREFTGDDALVIITLDDAGGIITGNVQVQTDPNIGDLRALFLQVIDESILPGLTISGPWVSEFVTGDDNIESVGGANVNGGGSPGPFEVGIAFGSSGIGADDIQAADFFMDHSTSDLTLAMFDLGGWAARMTSVGLPGGPREGSSKLAVVDFHLTGMTPPPDPQPSVTQPIPEPGTAALAAIAVVTGGWYLRRRHAAQRGR
jgi:hypothetical protein